MLITQFSHPLLTHFLFTQNKHNILVEPTNFYLNIEFTHFLSGC